MSKLTSTQQKIMQLPTNQLADLVIAAFDNYMRLHSEALAAKYLSVARFFSGNLEQMNLFLAESEQKMAESEIYQQAHSWLVGIDKRVQPSTNPENVKEPGQVPPLLLDLIKDLAG